MNVSTLAFLWDAHVADNIEVRVELRCIIHHQEFRSNIAVNYGHEGHDVLILTKYSYLIASFFAALHSISTSNSLII